MSSAVSMLLHMCKHNTSGHKETKTHLFRFAFVVSFRRAAPSKGLRSSNEQSKFSDTLQKIQTHHTGGLKGNLPHASTVIVKFLVGNRVRGEREALERETKIHLRHS